MRGIFFGECTVFSPYSRSEVRISHQGFVHRSGGFPAFPDRPYHQRLAPPHIPRRKNAGNRRGVPVRFRGTFVLWSTSTLKASVTYFWASQKSCRNKNQVRGDHFLAPLYGNHRHSSGFFVFPAFQFHDLCFTHISFFVGDEFFYRSLIDPWDHCRIRR